MKQKYTVLKDNEKKQLIIREYGELDKDMMSLLCEEAFEEAAILTAIEGGKPALISSLRSDNLYPPLAHAEKIAASVATLYQKPDQDTADIVFDDRELLAGEDDDSETYNEEDVDLDGDDEPDELDNLLDDDIKIKNTSSAIKIADDDSVEIDDDA